MGGLAGFGDLLKVSLLRRDAKDGGGLGAIVLLCQVPFEKKKAERNENELSTHTYPQLQFEPQLQPDPQLQDMLSSLYSVSSSNSRLKEKKSFEMMSTMHNLHHL
ncbi:hypothetical protein GUJ93_ZPchr0003g17712 [Zizania palustris]|uniref:Uncharacterized protein n=1 Tax=Zizania palustris TaxID=103762 RepID=A0A8J5RZM3_ZIZPA|nr:hypothetical protein GUJ93_ZPchr0003g17712 [Zizania palustris]